MDWLLGSPEPAKPPASEDWLLRARLCSWSYASTDEIRCELRLEPSAGVSAPLWVDWLAAQSAASSPRRGPPSPTPPLPSGAPFDEARAAAGDAGRLLRCVGAALVAFERASTAAAASSCARLPVALLPSYGTTVAIEWSPCFRPPDARAAAGGGAEAAGPSAGSACRSRLAARAGAAAPAAAARRRRPAARRRGELRGADDGDGGESDGGGVVAGRRERRRRRRRRRQRPRRFDVQVDGRQLAVVALETVGCPAGGALRGIIALAGGEPACELAALRLLLEEVLPERAAAAGGAAPPGRRRRERARSRRRRGATTGCQASSAGCRRLPPQLDVALRGCSPSASSAAASRVAAAGARRAAAGLAAAAVARALESRRSSTTGVAEAVGRGLQ